MQCFKDETGVDKQEKENCTTDEVFESCGFLKDITKKKKIFF